MLLRIVHSRRSIASTTSGSFYNRVGKAGGYKETDDQPQDPGAHPANSHLSKEPHTGHCRYIAFLMKVLEGPEYMSRNTQKTLTCHQIFRSVMAQSVRALIVRSLVRETQLLSVALSPR